MLKAISDELRGIRSKKRLSLEDVAKALHVSKETIRRYENNASGLSIEKLEKLLAYYEIDKKIFFDNVCANMHGCD
jgi:transcriptional regulator with XRE-family HTH domain